MKRTLLSALLVGSLCLTFSLAWSRNGHMMIASWAYWELSDSERTRWTEVLTHHPDYAKWLEDYDEINNNGIDSGEYLFMRASLWPDEIRRNTDNRYNHPAWHYINYPIEAPEFSEKPGWNPEDNIVFGMAQIRKILSDGSRSQEDRAAYFSWVLHLIGDLHQPLHSSALVNATYPDGDRGGNLFYVKPGKQVISLHFFWDGLLGTSRSARRAINERSKLRERFGRRALPELEQSRDVEAWTRESWEVAVNVAYQRGALKGSSDREQGSTLSQDYISQAKQAAERRAALAAYRMADWISSVR